MAQRIVIMAGGTGGHVFPALAVAQNLQQRGWHVSWLGTQAGLESRVIPAENIEIDWLSVAGFRGKGLFAKALVPLQVLRASFQALKVLRKRKPNIVLGMGGFVAGPGGAMAKLLGIPLVIHEQNRVPGTTNRLLSKIAVAVLEAFPQSFSASVGAICTGNPLRKSLLTLAPKNLWQGERDLRILVLGGSQGAQILNQVVPEVLAKLEGVEVFHQTGTVMQDMVQQQYANLGVNAQVQAFISDMQAVYAWADMLICRAGAMTVSEVAAAGLPAIFIPLPQAIDDHQTANAQVLVEAGAAVLLRQRDLDFKNLLEKIEQVQANIVTMSRQAKQAARLDATDVVAEICISKAKA